MPQTKRNPGTRQASPGALQADHERYTIGSKSSDIAADGQLNLLSSPSHPDAKALWPILLKPYQDLLNAAFDLEAYFPRQAVLCKRMADGLRDQMVDAELGMLNASPERRVAKRSKARPRNGR